MPCHEWLGCVGVLPAWHPVPPRPPPPLAPAPPPAPGSLSWGFGFHSKVAPAQGLLALPLRFPETEPRSCLPSRSWEFMNGCRARPRAGWRGRLRALGPAGAWLSSPWWDRQTDPLCLPDKSLYVLCSGDFALPPPGTGPARAGWPQRRLIEDRRPASPWGLGARAHPEGTGGNGGSSEAGPGCPGPKGRTRRWSCRGALSPGGREARTVVTGVGLWGQESGPAWARSAALQRAVVQKAHHSGPQTSPGGGPGPPHLFIPRVCTVPGSPSTPP